MINNLDLKLAGYLPVNKLELLELISSWGRIDGFNINELYIEKCEPKECYPLENLDA